jgi:cytochrome c biogenesis protein CcmG, thiol:disulfide interchange protein DsbE
MRKRTFLQCLPAVGGLALTTFGPPARAIDAGQPAPEFSLPLASGMLTPADLRGKLTYLDFWASWCGPCKQSFPWMNEMHARHAARGFQVVAINLDKKREDADRFLAELPARFKVAFDPKAETARLFAIKGMPSSALIAADGRLVFNHSGFRDEDRKDLEARILAALPTR